MDYVFLLHHTRSDDEYADDAKLIGAYRSREAAAAAIERLHDQPGFRDHPEGWDIQMSKLDEDNWREGFTSLPCSNLVLFQFEPDEDGCGKLLVSIEANGFNGHGEAWFSTKALFEFAKACSDYPITTESAPSLRGGFWDDNATSIKQVHVFISVQPYDLRGTLQAKIHLATEFYNNDDQPCSVNAKFLLTYEDLKAFADRFPLLLSGDETKVALRSSL
ncbi:hypothetical protein [Novosphingobium sp. SG720]|uniref:hypothetical protein n=1 Tax=Novosphingobium sp. SG720 TaxID=2586998 RepID=UPI0017D08DD3|nr:hypothetical protein [Novosphingobium sp. SG720]NKJ43325.1 hypothetical protein [Novosphingobium sp. SG720]